MSPANKGNDDFLLSSQPECVIISLAPLTSLNCPPLAISFVQWFWKANRMRRGPQGSPTALVQSLPAA